MEPVKKRKDVTFHTGLPMGTRATFVVDGQLWIAYPQPKLQRILAVTDRLYGTLAAINDDMSRWLNDWPDDAPRVLRVLDRIASGQRFLREMAVEKSEAVTQ